MTGWKACRFRADFPRDLAPSLPHGVLLGWWGFHLAGSFGGLVVGPRRIQASLFRCLTGTALRNRGQHGHTLSCGPCSAIQAKPFAESRSLTALMPNDVYD